MGITTPIFRHVAQQLGRPSGRTGPVTLRLLNLANGLLINAVTDALDIRPGQDVADIGFGGAHGLERMLRRTGPDGTVHGFDISDTALNYARRRFRTQIANGQLNVVDASICELPVPDASFDHIASANTIYYLSDENTITGLAEVARCLRPGGRFALGVGDPAFMEMLPFSIGLRLRPLEEVTGLLAAAGLEVVDHTRVGESQKAFHVLLTAKS